MLRPEDFEGMTQQEIFNDPDFQEAMKTVVKTHEALLFGLSTALGCSPNPLEICIIVDRLIDATATLKAESDFKTYQLENGRYSEN